MFFAQTVENVLANIRGDTEVIAVCDGDWPVPGLRDHSRLNVIHFTDSVGQRAATNAGARLSQSKYLMKLDAHCAVSEGFDVRLMEPYEDGTLSGDVTTIPRMYNLHAFDWVCEDGHNRYQGPPGPCEECGKETIRKIVWAPRKARLTDFARFDNDMKFQYWRHYGKRPEAAGDYAEVLCSVGAAWLNTAERWWELGGLDERHGSWGQCGVEVACKAWLSGGRQVVNKKAWFSHMFRTNNHGFGFPYPIRERDIEAARVHSRRMWKGGEWEGTKRPLQWLVDKFAPVPDWHPEEIPHGI